MKLITSSHIFLFYLGLSSIASAQTEFELRILNPTGFVAPGHFIEIIAEVINPVDSEIIIERVHTSIFGATGSISPLLFSTQSLTQQLRSRRYPDPPRHRLLSGSYPILPG